VGAGGVVGGAVVGWCGGGLVRWWVCAVVGGAVVGGAVVGGRGGPWVGAVVGGGGSWVAASSASVPTLQGTMRTAPA
jgi:hypothetical protein